jgi:hypothetical protein
MRSETKQMKPRVKDVQHKKAMADPKTNGMAISARRDWKNQPSLLEQASLVKALRQRGCTLRGLALEIGVATTTIRRRLKAADLSTEERAKVEQGGSLDAVLQARDKIARQKRILALLLKEQETGEVGARAAAIMLLAIKTHPALKVFGDDRLIFELSWRINRKRLTTSVPTSLKDLNKIIAYCLPRDSRAFEFEDLFQMLINIACSQTPSHLVACRAIVVLENLLRDYKEPSVRKDLGAIYREMCKVKTLGNFQRQKYSRQAPLLRGLGSWTRQSLTEEDW